MLIVACKVAKHKPWDDCPHDVFPILNSTVFTSSRLSCPLEVSARSRCASIPRCTVRAGFQTMHFAKHSFAYAATLDYIISYQVILVSVLNLFFILLGRNSELAN